ncbi:3-oxoacyl-[acyl-carrier-protein] reductase FabG [Roseivivax jejudonensis]|uniref:3-oxoacyl-[acyl-carrier-protein] reductase FabG n=1 Tax=Roseivivax jejudonensis TaxID=1529041 RepID=A0A1X6Z2Q9_9RHOB|nr:SDR family oxidoreductase [Roseivivax jejudonensis]SLN38821.1 3-oxoacyl-[acyl-carrier-protein] reductase FabG [Roseivivax jejudonensis]
MSDPVALVTGASRGLGFALAETLAPTHHVVAVARTVGALEDLDDRIKAAGGAATLAPMDVTIPEAMAQLCRSIHDRWGGAALWCHTAIEAGPLGPADHIAAKDWQKAIAVNVTAMGHLVPYIAPLLGPSGRAVFFADDSATGAKFFGNYGATKSAQIALARSWAAETANIGPRVDVVTPRPMPTAMRARFFPGEDKSALADPREEARRLLSDIGVLAA